VKIVTGHDLLTGEVVYLTAEGAWRPRLAEAAGLDDAAAEIARASVDPTRITNVYLIAADAPGAPAARERLRETIRAQGPTVRRDLGKQAERAQ
jgi:hypothetical protein